MSPMREKLHLALIALSFGIISLCCEAWADPIVINNPSFEADVLCEGCNSLTIIGWEDTSGGGDGAFNPTTTHYPGGAVPDGQNVSYANGPGNFVRQTLTTVLVADTIYTLEVEVGNRLDDPFAGYSVQLRAGGMILASDSSQAPGDGQFVTSTVTYTSSPTDPQLGQPLEIWLLASGVQANFDNVRLDADTFPVELMSFTIE